MTDSIPEAKMKGGPVLNLADGSLVANRFEIRRLLGSGGMGQVYLALDRELNSELVALKVLHQTLAQDQRIFERFRNEVSVARTLAHSNIVRTHDLGKAPEGFYYITMEYVEGSSLKERIEGQGPFGAIEAAAILTQVLGAIEYAHSRGVIHRDLKPANILILPNGEVKLADFGTARLLSSQLELTPTGHLIGTPSYMAPEQVRGEELDPRCDIYALGIIGYEIVIGKRPFDGESYVTTAFKHVNEDLPAMAAVKPDIPAWYESAIRKATEKAKEQRFQSATAFLEGLKVRSNRFSKSDAPSGRADHSLFVKALFALSFLAAMVLMIVELRKGSTASVQVSSKPTSFVTAQPTSEKQQDTSTSIVTPSNTARETLQPPASPKASENNTADKSLPAFTGTPARETPRPETLLTQATERSPGQLFFRSGLELAPSERIELQSLNGSRWILVIDPSRTSVSREAIATAMLSLTRKGEPRPSLRLTGKVLSLGSPAAPEIRIGGTLQRVPELSPGTYQAEVRSGEKVLATAEIVFY